MPRKKRAKTAIEILKAEVAQLRREKRLMNVRYKEVSGVLFLWKKGDRSKPTIQKIHELASIRVDFSTKK